MQHYQDKKQHLHNFNGVLHHLDSNNYIPPHYNKERDLLKHLITAGQWCIIMLQQHNAGRRSHDRQVSGMLCFQMVYIRLPL